MGVGRSQLPLVEKDHLLEVTHSTRAFLPVGYYEDDFLLSCLIEAMILYSSINLSKTLMIEGF